MFNNKMTAVKTGRVRASYVNLLTPRPPKNASDEPRYSVTLLIPKSDIATKQALDLAIKAAYDEGVVSMWGGSHPTPKSIIHDGDAERPNGGAFGDECKGHWVLATSRKAAQGKPWVCSSENTRVELLPQEAYSGMYGRAVIDFRPYNNAGGRGVTAKIEGFVKTEDGEPLTGSAVSPSMFDEDATQPAAAPAYGAQPNYAAPATPTYQAPAAPAYQQPVPQQYAQPAAPQQGGVRINPITGQPM